jgi:hypothetical protein
LEINPQHVIIWTALSAKRLFAPYFFEGCVNQGPYLSILWDWLVLRLECWGLLGHVYFQQDVAPAHYAIAAKEFLSKVFKRQVDWPWITAFTGASGVAALKSGSVIL